MPAEAAAIFEQATRLAETLDGSREVMNAAEAADFLRLSLAEFRRQAASLPRHQVSNTRYLYVRSELLEWLMSR
jgi:phage tail tape-measure protein